MDNIDPASGNSIVNIQKQFNNNKLEVSSTLTIAAAGAIVFDEVVGNHVIPVIGSGGAVDASSVPFGSVGSSGNAYKNGTIVMLIGTSDTNPVTYKDNDAANGFILNGDAKLEKYSSLTLLRIDALGRWLEIARSI